MQFLNLSASELFFLFAGIGGFITSLYLLDRAHRRRVVSTLKFWTGFLEAPRPKRRRKLDQPWSLVLQLLSLFLILLAIAEVQLGHRTRPGSHVLLLDTSSASAVRISGGTVLDQEKKLAAAYLARIGRKDRVMLVRVDELTQPATPFTSDRDELLRAIDASVPEFSALSVDHAFAFADHARHIPDAEPGEIVYIGPQLGESPGKSFTVPERTRLITVGPLPANNAGIRSVTVSQSGSGNAWHAVVAITNYAHERKLLEVDAQIPGTGLKRRFLTIDADRTRLAEYDFVASQPSEFHVRIQSGDSFPEDDQASVHVAPAVRRVAVFTSRPELLGPALRAGSDLEVDCFPPSAYIAKPQADLAVQAQADLAVLDGFSPAERPSIPSLRINPPPPSSPFPIAGTVTHRAIEAWSADPSLSAGLRRRDTILASANVFRSFDVNTAVALVREGPVAIAVDSGGDAERMAVLGFDPFAESLRFDPAMALLLRNLVRWAIPNALKSNDASAARLGLHEIALDAPFESREVSVKDASGSSIPFSLRSGLLQFFCARPATITLRTPRQNAVVRTVLPDFSPLTWDFGSNAAHGLPRRYAVASFTPWRWLAAAAGLILAFEWFRFGHRNRMHTLLKVCGLAAVVGALLVPDLRVKQERPAVLAVVDVSDSIGGKGRETAIKRISDIAAYKPANWLRIAPFARDLGAAREFSHVRVDSVNGSDATDIERALEQGMTLLPSGYVPRLVLVSDGNENQGSAVRAIERLKATAIPVDTIPIGSAGAKELRVRSISMPARAYAGESVPIDLMLDSPVDTRAKVDVSAAQKALGSENVDLHAGSTPVRIRTRLTSAGAAILSIQVTAGNLGSVRTERAITLTQPRALYISEDPPGTESNLLGALEKAQFEITRDTSLLRSGLAGVQLIILNNVDPHEFSQPEAEHVADFVERGGGLILIGGERELYRTDSQAGPIDRVLPARLLPPETPEGICVALVIDKSSSMEGRKIELARASAIGVVDHLRPQDTIGVLIFDNSHEWAVPMRRVADKQPIKRLIAGITPDGGTQIPPALAEAYRRVLRAKANFKHILLLTDGISEEGDSIELAKEALLHQVTISTVGLGQDVNKSYLQKIAAASGGNSYFLNDPQGLQQIVLKDVEQYTGRTAIEKPLAPLIERPSEILNGIDFKAAPALKGYVRFEAKRGADTILSIDPQKREALFVRWQYGLGRAAVFASDAKSRWADSWVSWSGYDRFWINVARDLVRPTDAADAQAQFDEARGALHVRYRAIEEPRTTDSPDRLQSVAGSRTISGSRPAACAAIQGQVPIWGEVFTRFEDIDRNSFA
ncbi:MAG: VWA domain-containing protein, partial [Acidobacteriaceae bacterium]|nr:VWA domain-containing protein [Acidobacteriaceae bacterium]